MSDKVYSASPNMVTPTTAQNSINQSLNNNPIGSESAALYGKDTTSLLKRDIYEKIIINTPAQFSALRLLLSRPTLFKNDREFTWEEKNWSRPSLVAGSGSSTTKLVLTAGQGSLVAVNDVVVYPDNTHAVITAISGDELTVEGVDGATVPSATAGDLLVMSNVVSADGQNWLSHSDRVQVVEHTNYIGRGQRSKRWTRETKQKYLNSGTTDYYNVDMMDKTEQAYADMFAMFFNGKKGKFKVTNPSGTAFDSSLTGNGIYNMLVDSGAQFANSNPLTILADFKKLAQNTNYKNVMQPRFIFGTDKMLTALSEAAKNPIRYAPSDKIADLNLTQYEIGTMKFVPIVTELFKASSYLFPAFFENLLLVLDIDTINPTCMKGFQPIEIGDTSKLAKENGGVQDWTDFYVDYMIGLQMSNTDSSFYIKGTGF